VINIVRKCSVGGKRNLKKYSKIHDVFHCSFKKKRKPQTTKKTDQKKAEVNKNEKGFQTSVINLASKGTGLKNEYSVKMNNKDRKITNVLIFLEAVS